MNGQYIGCGSGAHSYYNNFRRANIASIEEYIKRIENRESVTAYQEAIDRETEIFETLMLGLRLKAGISKKAFADRFGFVLEERYSMEIERLRKQGLLAEDKDSIYPTTKGFDFQNKIALSPQVNCHDLINLHASCWNKQPLFENSIDKNRER